ncbi:MAG: Ca2+/calmodulin-dependent protein phosphatase (calcineurin subunit B), EF-Hand superfamily protein [Amphiamblys sp. WSBS2006]|nr:MAG: Ca2+/calmodulin-dependent protein phosphatase (calcineurin subunit B), EF-Hand superfamily protein [Amphiamblys sp. WSBS2006]
MEKEKIFEEVFGEKDVVVSVEEAADKFLEYFAKQGKDLGLKKDSLCVFIAALDRDKDGHVKIETLLGGIIKIAKKKSRKQKLALSFSFYDMDGDDYISAGELYLVLRALSNGRLDDVSLQQIVDKTILQADTIDGDSKISFDEFVMLLSTEEKELLHTLDNRL